MSRSRLDSSLATRSAFSKLEVQIFARVTCAQDERQSRALYCLLVLRSSSPKTTKTLARLVNLRAVTRLAPPSIQSSHPNKLSQLSRLCFRVLYRNHCESMYTASLYQRHLFSDQELFVSVLKAIFTLNCLFSRVAAYYYSANCCYRRHIVNSSKQNAFVCLFLLNLILEGTYVVRAALPCRLSVATTSSVPSSTRDGELRETRSRLIIRCCRLIDSLIKLLIDMHSHCRPLFVSFKRFGAGRANFPIGTFCFDRAILLNVTPTSLIYASTVSSCLKALLLNF